MPPSAAPTPELLAGLGGLRLQAEALLAGTLAGMHRSPFQGFSAEFDQYRGYAPGDDPRFFDWRIFGRTGQAMVKRFRDETNTSLYLVADNSASMGGKREESSSKLQVASLMAAALATLAFRQRDAVGLFAGGSQLALELPPRSGAAHYQEVVQRLESLKPQGLTDLGHLLSLVSQRLKSGSMVFVFTDLWQEPEALLSGLRQLRSRCQALALVQILSADERDLLDKGDRIYRDMESGETLHLSPEAFRESYAAAFDAHQGRIRGACRDLAVRFHAIDMALPLDLGLRALLRDFAARPGR